MKNINETEAGFENPQNKTRYYQKDNNIADLKIIPQKLPISYRLSTEKNNCSNCNFFIENFCNLWGAEVRGYHENPWICNAWANKIEKEELRIDNQGNPIALDS